MSGRRTTAPPPAVTDDPRSFPLPDLRLLTDRLHYNLQEGLIWFDDRRVLTLSAAWFGELRAELIDSLGMDGARRALTRLGYGAGLRDAQVAMKLHSDMSVRDMVLVGIQFHALQGTVRVVPTVYDVDLEAGRFRLVFEWHNSVEDQLHIERSGVGEEAACWMEVGYASGFLSTCLRRPVVVREVHCRAAGAEVCVCEARTVDGWHEADQDQLRQQAVPLDWRSLLPEPPRPGSTRRPVPSSKDDSANSIIGRSALFEGSMLRLRKVARTNATVLFLGESGVGKSAFARELHRQSRRRHKPLLEVNCAAIPENLIESELFGVDRGAYTGAQTTRAGRFEEAEGGSLFLDEIGMLSLIAQGKLLRVLQNQEYERLGSSKTRRADVRIIAATNENLEEAVKAGRFRLDLFFRLNVVPIHIAPLRERRDDLPVLLEQMLQRFMAAHDRQVTGFTARAIRALLAHDWPGNIREVENVIERGVILAEDGAAIDLPQLFTVDMSFEQPGLLSLRGDGLVSGESPTGTSVPAGVREWLKGGHGGLLEIEQALVRSAVEDSGGNVAAAARLLRITRAQIDQRLKRMRE